LNTAPGVGLEPLAYIRGFIGVGYLHK